MRITCELCEATLEVQTGGGRAEDRRKAFNLGLCYGFKRRRNDETEGGWDRWFRYVCPECAALVLQAIERAVDSIRVGDA